MTLVEVAVVIVILAILAAVGAPRFFSSAAFRERFFSEELLAALRYAQKLAIASGCDVQVSLAGNAYALTQRLACQGGPFAQSVRNPGTSEPTYANPAPPGSVVGSTVDPIIFDALGRARDAALSIVDATVTVGTRSINVVGETGFVFDPAS
jgi:MSHA pilin protein MshC